MEFSTPFSLNNVNQTSATMECMMYQLILGSYPAITDTNISVIPISKGDKLGLLGITNKQKKKFLTKKIL